VIFLPLSLVVESLDIVCASFSAVREAWDLFVASMQLSALFLSGLMGGNAAGPRDERARLAAVCARLLGLAWRVSGLVARLAYLLVGQLLLLFLLAAAADSLSSYAG